MIWLLIIAGGSVALAFFLLMEIATLPARERMGSIRRAAGYGKNRVISTSSSVLDDGTFKDRALVPMKTGLARGVLRITPRASVETVSNKLLRAGLNRKVSPTGYLASKAILCFVGFVGGQVFASLGGALASKGASARDRVRDRGLHAPRRLRHPEDARRARRSSGPSCRTLSTSSPSRWRQASASTGPSRS